MPFTISHAAAALPLHALGKSRLPLAALMIGCLSPDFAYFLPDGFGYLESHDLAGVFLFCLPAGLAVWLFFVSVLERPTIAFLPDAWRARITPSARITLRGLLLGALAIVLGAFTHLVWDSFTHAATPVTDTFPIFRAELFKVGGMTIRVYFLLQVLSSVFGLAVLAMWAYRIRSKPVLARTQAVPALTPRVSHFERGLAVLMIAAAAGATALFNVARYGSLRLDGVLFVLLIGGMAGTVAGWTVVAIGIRFRSRQTKVFAQPNAE